MVTSGDEDHEDVVNYAINGSEGPWKRRRSVGATSSSSNLKGRPAAKERGVCS
jgi:hypothetical protein